MTPGPLLQFALRPRVFPIPQFPPFLSTQVCWPPFTPRVKGQSGPVFVSSMTNPTPIPIIPGSRELLAELGVDAFLVQVPKVVTGHKFWEVFLCLDWIREQSKSSSQRPEPADPAPGLRPRGRGAAIFLRGSGPISEMPKSCAARQCCNRYSSRRKQLTFHR